MAFKIFNTLSRSLEEFVPLDPDGKRVGMYCCGPTVYDYAHVGNWRTFVFGDLVRRYLEFKGFKPVHVMNVTDVEDKIIRRVAETGGSLRDFTSKFEAAFFEDSKSLNCLNPHQTPHATDFVPEIIALIERLVERGLAYRASDGSVYFSIKKYRETGSQYGKLVKLNFEEMRAGERVKSDEYAKEAVGDFALWKARNPEDGNVFWPSPWGEGRPGWHIECSAMSMKLLGPSFDLHLGGEDLAFPHHEDEIAQSEGSGLQASGRPFVKYWMHGAHLMVEGKKMAKSLGNFFTLRDLLAKGYSGREVRFLLLQAHYRETFNFTLGGLDAARSALLRLDECIGKLRELGRANDSQEPDELPRRVEAFLDEDLNISGAWGAVFDWVSDLNRKFAANALGPAAASAALAGWIRVDSVLGIGLSEEVAIPEEIIALVEARQAARKAKDFKKADSIRDELKAKGWVVDDTPKGARAKRA